MAVSNTFVRTVLGDIRPEEVGFAHCHEHAFLLPGPSSQVDDTLLLDDLDRTAAELADFHAAGGRTIVDAQPIGQERSPRMQIEASRKSGVHIVATTGLHRSRYYPADHFRFRETPDALAGRMIEEVTRGMGEYSGSRAVRTSKARAGLLKFATEYHLVDAESQRAAEAVAIAQQQTGAPVLTHTERGTCALQQIALMERFGVPASTMLISHLDRNPDVYLHEDVAAAGAYIVYDGISRVKYYPDSTIVELICRMVDSGHAGKVLLAMDMGSRTMWRHYGGGPGMTYLAEVFLPKLRRAGLDQQQIDLFTVHNPSVALSFRQPDLKE